MKKLIIPLLLLLITNFTFAQTSTAPAAGDGTFGNPYQIATLDNLYWLSQEFANYSAKYFIQTEDIDASTTSTWDSGAGFSPIGNTSNRFTGNYNGDNYSIDNLYINRPGQNYVGLFGYTDGGEIKNLGLKNVDIKGLSTVGGLVGMNYSTISNSYATGAISGSNLTGGLVGENNKTISNSYATGTVSGTNNVVGGLVGMNNSSSTISNSYATGAVSGSNLTGGLAGYNAFATISNSYSTGAVSGVNGFGGLVGGNNSGNASNCFWDTETSGKPSSVLGTGKTTAEIKTQATFTDATWDFVDETTNGTNDYWKIDGTNNAGYPYLAWQIWPSTDPTATPPASGDGTFGNPYQIATLDNLYWLSQEFANYSAKYFIQTEDIDAASTTTWDGGQGFLPIGTGSYSDVYYNGNGKTISNLYINRPNTSSVGLFSATQKSIFNVTLTNVDIVGHTFVGGLAGRNEGAYFINCSVSGSVSGIASTGGLVGYLYYGVIKRSKSTANVTGVFNASPGVWGIGGLVGAFDDVGRLLDCYATGSVTGVSDGVTLGGLVGTIPLTATIFVENCYSTGAVSGPEGTTTGGLIGSGADVGYTNCFWDSEASLQSTSAAGTSKTTAEMKSIGTYVGWNFDYTWAILAAAYPTFDFRLPALSGGDGTALTPYLVSTFADLVAISKYQDFFGLSFKQTANIDASASSVTAFTSIGDGVMPFNGSYDGDGYSIDGLAFNSLEVDPHGLFGIMNNASIDNVNITNCSIDAGVYVGSIAGHAISSSITNCSATGQLRAVALCGGIVGILENSTIANCYADVDITENDIYGAELMTHFGGIVGAVNGTSSVISNSYALGSVSGNKFIGGLVGGVDLMSSFMGGFQSPSSDMGFTMTNCYAANTQTASAGTAGGILGQSNYVNTGSVTITNSFWDQELAGTTEGYIGGTGKTTAEMKTQSTFTGWDFSTAPIWEIDASKNNGLPNLAWKVFASAAQAMQLVFTTTDFNQSIQLPLYGTVNCTVDWGDGTANEDFTSEGNKPHTFFEAGTYTVKISGSLTQFGDSENGAWSGADFLTEVGDFGNLGLISLNSAFYGAINLTSVPAILPSTVTNLASCFARSEKTTLTNLNLWDVSNVTSMNRMFWRNESFNQSLDNWNVSNVTDMTKMFDGAMAFNKPLNSWVVSNVTNMSSMFEGAESFDQALNNWDVSKVEDMSSMFRNAWSFNQPLNSWDVSKVATMKRMFRGAESFDQALNDWVVSGVTNMSGMFDGAMTFNQPLNNWNVSNVTNMSYMFTDAESFNQPLNNWDVSSVEDMESMLDGVTLSITNYDAILIAWAAQTVQPNVIFGVGDNQYSAGAAATARGILTGETNLWEIYDGGIVYPEITVKQGTSIIENGTGNYDFGSQNATTNTDIVFTIENAGVTASALGNFSITGDNANQFAVLVATPTTVAAGESVTFTVRFSPTSVGAKTATLRFDNEDEDGNPFSFSITGNGVDVGTSVENSTAALILQVSPNPASYQIRVDGFVGEAEITIINMLGKVCQKSRISSESYVAIDHLPKGMYLVQVNYKNNTAKLKLMKD